MILGKAEGNPFFVEEVIARADRSRRSLRTDGDGWVTTPLIETVSVPDTLQGPADGAPRPLPDETKWVVQQASVIGRIFLYRVLLQMDRTAHAASKPT